MYCERTLTYFVGITIKPTGLSISLETTFKKSLYFQRLKKSESQKQDPNCCKNCKSAASTKISYCFISLVDVLLFYSRSIFWTKHNKAFSLLKKSSRFPSEGEIKTGRLQQIHLMLTCLCWLQSSHQQWLEDWVQRGRPHITYAHIFPTERLVDRFSCCRIL